MAPKWFPLPDLVSLSAARRSWLAYGVAVVGTTTAFFLELVPQGLDPRTPLYPLYPLFTLAIILSALSGGLRPGLLALGFALFYNVSFILLPHHWPPAPEHLDDWSSLAAFAGVGVSVSVIAAILLRNQRRLAESEQRLRAIFDNAGVGVVEVDAQGRLTAVNDHVCEILGSSREQLLGMTVDELTAPEDQARSAELHAQLREGQLERVENEKRCVRRDGSLLWVHVTFSAVRDAKGRYLRSIGTVEDFSQHRAAEEALIRTEKLASVGRMAATIAHEVNNPLAAATNAVYLASADPGLSPQGRDALHLADQELRRAAHVTQQTLGFCRETDSRAPLALPKLIDEVLQVFARKLRDRGITVQQRYKCGPCREECEACFVANAGHLRQVLSNLLANGMDALRDNGTLHVRLCRMSGFGEKGKMIRLTIADNGCGIRAENMKRIFEPFFTTKASVGTGLGLWISQEIISKYGGSVRVRSQTGKGTVFCVTVPAINPEASTEYG